MSSYTISPTLNKSRVFILQKSELEKRFDPIYYAHEYNNYDKKLSKKPFKKFHQILKSINNGYDFRDYKESGTPYLKVANVKKGELDFTKIQYIDFNSSEISKNIQLKKGNLLLTRKGTFGNAFALDKDYDFVISSEVFYIELQDNSINPKFLEIFFNSKIGQAQFDKNKIGAIMGSLSQEAIRDLKIPLPSSAIQNQIVDIYENYILEKQKNEAEAEKLLSSIDDYLLNELGINLPKPPENTLKNRMFVANFKSIESRLDPQFYLTYFTELENAIKSSPNKTLRLDTIFEINRGGSPRPIHDFLTEDENGYNWVKIGDTKNNDKYIYQTADKIIPEGARYSRKVEVGDFILSNSMSFGRPYIMQIEGYIHDGWLLFKPKFSDFNADYFHSILSSKLIYQLFKKATIGGVVENLNIDLVKKVSIPVPPIEKQKEIAEHITSIRQQAQKLKDKTNEILEKASEEIEEILLN